MAKPRKLMIPVAQLSVGKVRAAVILISLLLIVCARAAHTRNVALRPGDIIVADRSASDGVGAVIRIDPKSGAQSSISSGGLLSQVDRITSDGKGRILVTLRVSESTHRLAGIARINPATGAQKLLSSGGRLLCPSGIATEADGKIVVVDPCAVLVIRVDSQTGRQTVISSGKNLIFPEGIAIAADQSIIVAASKSFGGTGAILSIDPATGVEKVISARGNFSSPTDVAVDRRGRILVADFNSFACGPGGYTGRGAGAIFGLARSSDVQTLISCDHLFQGGGPHGIAVEADDQIVVTSYSDYAKSVGKVIRIDPVTGAQTRVSSAGMLVAPTGIAVVVANGAGGPTSRVVGSRGAPVN